ncbi:MAG: CrcB family protein, partial [Aldersonia sp.]|nr:CrcB family protein [Aldersonia sp.]
GGGLGALGRYGVSLCLPTRPGHIPWGTLVTNVTGGFLIGVLLVLITELWAVHRLWRPFLGVGVLGGYTTFSAYAVEMHDLFLDGTEGVAFGYLAVMLVAGLAAVVLGVASTRFATGISRDRE